MQNSNERKLQSRGIEWFAWALPDVMVIAVPNEQAISMPPLPDDIYALLLCNGKIDRMQQVFATQRMIAIQNLKRAGMYVGCADLLLFQRGANGIECIGALETKDKAPQSANQKKFQAHWEKLGGRYAIWRSLEELRAICVAWGLRPNVGGIKGVPHTKKQMQANMYHDIMMSMARENN